jgi:hypothetical protein
MEILENELYDDFAAEFQFEMIKILNETLKKHKIPLDTRKEICGDFTFDFSMLIDQGEIKDSTPIITFFQDKKLYIRNETFEFHEYAFGNTDEVFEDEAS